MNLLSKMNASKIKIALMVQYNGARYHGWQFQNAHTATVQGELEKALSKIAAGELIKVHCAGRTDAGVHASGQVVHFECAAERETKAWTEGVNSVLPADISVQWASKVREDFHARFSALSRRYRYFIWNNKFRPALNHQNLTWYKYPLDAEAMHDSAQVLLGELDFQAFRGAACQSHSSFRNVSEILVQRQGDYVQIDIEANAFLLHMVRNIVGVLLPVGQGQRSASWVKQVLESRDRKQAGITAPAAGLHLVAVRYPEEFAIPVLAAPSYLQQR